MTVKHKENKQGPRKLLALDGGGIRGVMALEILATIESQLQKALKLNNDFVLADYFDYIAGTSTGAIIASCLSMGMRVDEITKFYLASGPDMFDKTRLIKRFYRNKFHNEKLKAKLRQVIESKTGDADTTLGSDALKTYLLLVLRNATTDSPWPLSNNPAAIFNNPLLGNNLQLPLWQLIRASTAAPTYFPPEVIKFGSGNEEYEFVFVDGGVTMYNNPAFQLFLMSTVAQYKLEWPVGEDKMLLVSVGTGTAANANKNLQPDEMNIVYNAKSIPAALMFAASNEQDLLCRVFGKCLNGGRLDLEVMDLIGPIGKGPVSPKLFTYMRYTADLSRKGLNDLGLPEITPENVQQLDSTDHIGEIQKVGRAVAKEVNIAHFEGFLN